MQISLKKPAWAAFWQTILAQLAATPSLLQRAHLSLPLLTHYRPYVSPPNTVYLTWLSPNRRTRKFLVTSQMSPWPLRCCVKGVALCFPRKLAPRNALQEQKQIKISLEIPEATAQALKVRAKLCWRSIFQNGVPGCNQPAAQSSCSPQALLWLPLGLIQGSP